MSGQPLNLMAGLKDVSSRGKSGEKFAIQIESEDLLFDPNDQAAAKTVADELVAQIKRFLHEGRRPDGTQLPGITRPTEERREFEAGQGQRGGEASNRYVDTGFRREVVQNYRRDYTGARSGKVYTPKDGGPRGVVSGMLVDSFFARPNRDGKGVTIYVAAKRGEPRPGETKSALQSVFGDGKMVNASAMATPQIRGAVRDAARAMLGVSNGPHLRLVRDDE